MPPPVYKRHVELSLRQALNDSPVVLIQGPRQCGKTTLVKSVGESAGYEYFTLDEESLRLFASEDPQGFVSDLGERVILDEAQRAPELFPSIKLAVDRDRMPGRFILTGSTNLLQMKQVKESLAGRIDIVNLHPFSQCELERVPATFLDVLFSPGFSLRQGASRVLDIIDRLVAGGYPAALQRVGVRRDKWYRDYIHTMLANDAQAISMVRFTKELSTLLDMSATQTARLLKVDSITTSLKLNWKTINGYLALLEKIFILQRLRPWHSNRAKRMVKSPKLHLGDTGVVCALLNVGRDALKSDRALLGQILETFVFQELVRQASASAQPHSFHHFRDRDQAEVDIVIQRGRAIAGVEVKASATIKDSDFKGLRKLRSAAGKHFTTGVVLYNGERTFDRGDQCHAVPIQMLWEAAGCQEDSCNPGLNTSIM